MLLDGLVEFQLAVDDIAHQVDASPGTVGLVAGLDVGGTGGRAQAAVDAVEHQLVVDDWPLPRSSRERERGHRCFRGRTGHFGWIEVVLFSTNGRPATPTSDAIHKSPRVENPPRVEFLFDRAHHRTVAGRAAPDGQIRLPLRGAACNDQVAFRGGSEWGQLT